MMRKRLFEELDAIAQGAGAEGHHPQRQRRAVHRAAEHHQEDSVEGITLAEYDNYPLLKARLKGFRHCYGQPPEVRQAFEEAMGIAK